MNTVKHHNGWWHRGERRGLRVYQFAKWPFAKTLKTIISGFQTATKSHFATNFQDSMSKYSRIYDLQIWNFLPVVISYGKPNKFWAHLYSVCVWLVIYACLSPHWCFPLPSKMRTVQVVFEKFTHTQRERNTKIHCLLLLCLRVGMCHNRTRTGFADDRGPSWRRKLRHAGESRCWPNIVMAVRHRQCNCLSAQP